MLDGFSDGWSDAFGFIDHTTWRCLNFDVTNDPIRSVWRAKVNRESKFPLNKMNRWRQASFVGF